MGYKSYLQTVEVYLPESTNRFLTLKYAPPRLLGEYDCMMYDFDPFDRKTTYWYPDQTIRIEYETGKVEIYHPKPTIQDVFDSDYSGQYFRQHSNGTVEHGWGGVYYYWGPGEEVEWSFQNGPWYLPRSECPCESCEEWREDEYLDDDDSGSGVFDGDAYYGC